MNSSFFWLLLNIISIGILAFYSMMEMACVSFNKVRLQYYVSKGSKRAIWLNYMIQNPAHLFGTTLIGVNIALVVGSEFARQFYESLGFSPDIAPLTQVILVVIFGELAPMFAARRYAEHVALLGIPLVYTSAKIMSPLLWIISRLSKVFDLIGGKKEAAGNIYLTQEELLNILEDKGEDVSIDADSAEFSAVAGNIFSLRGKDIRQIMKPIISSLTLPSNATIGQMKEQMTKSDASYMLLYSQDPSNIVGIAYPHNVLRYPDSRRVRDHASSPWFVSDKATLMQILKQFRTNSEDVAVILNSNGKAIGLVELDDILDEIFVNLSLTDRTSQPKQKKLVIVDKSFPGDTTVQEFNSHFGVLLDEDPMTTLSELIASHLGHKPEKGESIYIAPFELTVKETTLLDVKTVSISTRMG